MGLLMLYTVISLMGSSQVKTHEVTKEESQSLSCNQIKDGIAELKDFLDISNDARIIAGVFGANTYDAAILIFQARLRLSQLESLSVLKRC